MCKTIILFVNAETAIYTWTDFGFFAADIVIRPEHANIRHETMGDDLYAPLATPEKTPREELKYFVAAVAVYRRSLREHALNYRINYLIICCTH